MKKAESKDSSARKVSKFAMKMLLFVGVIAAAIVLTGVFTLVIDAYGFDITIYKTDVASTIYAVDEGGNYAEYEQLYSEEKRVWVPIDEIPVHV